MKTKTEKLKEFRMYCQVLNIANCETNAKHLLVVNRKHITLVKNM